jgi:hypothetical protein
MYTFNDMFICGSMHVRRHVFMNALAGGGGRPSRAQQCNSQFSRSAICFYECTCAYIHTDVYQYTCTHRSAYILSIWLSLGICLGMFYLSGYIFYISGYISGQIYTHTYRIYTQIDRIYTQIDRTYAQIDYGPREIEYCPCIPALPLPPVLPLPPASTRAARRTHTPHTLTCIRDPIP